jgi:Mg/Co/Ni transporter MgtE
LFTNTRAILNRKVIAIAKIQTELSALSKSVNENVIDKLTGLLSKFNADVLLLSFSGLTENSIKQKEVIGQVTSALNRTIFEPFSDAASTAVKQIDLVE